MKAKPWLGCVFCLATFWAGPLFGDNAPPLAEPHSELYQAPNRPVGVLGLPLGTFAVIEGTEQASNMGNGGRDFLVEVINGKNVGSQVRIPTDWPSQLPDKRITGKRYVLHGYEKGTWGGSPDGLPREEPFHPQVASFFFQPEFAVTSVEKVDGVTTPDARPVDPNVPLAEPKFEAKADSKPPVGVLGLPLGTFAIIEAHTPERGVMMESSFEVDIVNGRHLDIPQFITIRNVPSTKGDERVTLHGFEIGEWKSQPPLPDSEYPRSAPQPQKPFQFFHQFVVTSPLKTGA